MLVSTNQQIPTCWLQERAAGAGLCALDPSPSPGGERRARRGCPRLLTMLPWLPAALGGGARSVWGTGGAAGSALVIVLFQLPATRSQLGPGCCGSSSLAAGAPHSPSTLAPCSSDVGGTAVGSVPLCTDHCSFVCALVLRLQSPVWALSPRRSLP